MNTGWRYYNHALLPDCAPHENANLSELDIKRYDQNSDKSIYFARYTYDFDCKTQTEWWYCILDKPFDISLLKAKRRYEINKGLRFFDVINIDDFEKYKEDIYKILVKAYSAYPEKYRPVTDIKEVYSSVAGWNKGKVKVYGAFYKETGEMCGYAYLEKHSSYLNFNVLKTIPEYEKFGINAAIVYKIVSDEEERLKNGNFYICDGERSIFHETAFQDYLEKYFGFRKAYCKLNIIYKPKIRVLIKILYPFRKVIYKLNKSGFICKVISILKMEEIVRRQKKFREKS